MVKLGWTRGTINAGMSRIRRIFKYAIANELIDASILPRLQCVAPLLAGLFLVSIKRQVAVIDFQCQDRKCGLVDLPSRLTMWIGH